jgi:hypothetical protein
MYVGLHDDDCTQVTLGECPFDLDFHQERYLIDYYSQYKNHMQPNGVPINRDAFWIKQGVSTLQVLHEKEEEMRRKAAEAKSKKR